MIPNIHRSFTHGAVPFLDFRITAAKVMDVFHENRFVCTLLKNTFKCVPENVNSVHNDYITFMSMYPVFVSVELTVLVQMTLV